MGNQVSCDIGPDFVEIGFYLQEIDLDVLDIKQGLATTRTFPFEFFVISKVDIGDFKMHPMYQKLEKNLIPVLVSGITYDSFFSSLPEIFECAFERSEKFNYSIPSIDYYWRYFQSGLYEYNLLSVPEDGSISICKENYIKVPVQTTELYPYLLVSVKSGVSIYEVLEPNCYKKIGGSCLGLNSIWALLKGNGNESFEELIQQAESGDSSRVDMTVSDIYGTRYSSLPEKITASSCGKLKDSVPYEKKDLTKSLLFMLLFNLGQIAAMHCFDLKITKIVVVGSVFMNEYVCRLMRFTLNYYSKGELRMIFSENSRFLRCLGILLSNRRILKSNTL